MDLGFGFGVGVGLRVGVLREYLVGARYLLEARRRLLAHLGRYGRRHRVACESVVWRVIPNHP